MEARDDRDPEKARDLRETLRAGNPTFDFTVDWVDYQAAGATVRRHGASPGVPGKKKGPGRPLVRQTRRAARCSLSASLDWIKG